MKKNLNQRIREYLETQSEPVLPMTVAAAVDAPRARVSNALTTMKASGMVLHEKGKGYYKGGRKPMTVQEASMLGGLARAATAKPKPPKKPKSISLTPRKLGITEAAAVRETFPDTDSFIRANPDRHIQLPQGVWSNPVLRFEY